MEESSKSKIANRWVGACTALQLVQCKVYSVQFTGTCSALQLVQCVHRCQVYTAHLLMAWEVGASRQAPHFRSWAALHGTALHGTALYCTALHCTALHCTYHYRVMFSCTQELLHSAPPPSLKISVLAPSVQCSAADSSLIQCSAKKVQCSAVQCSAVQCSTVQCRTST